MNNKNLFLILGIIALVAVFYFVTKNNSTKSTANPQAKKLEVTTSFYPIYFFTTQIAGDKADVKNLTPSGSEPHDYEPTSQDIARIETSNLLILNGGVESWGNKIKDNLKDKNIPVIIAGEGLETRQLTEEGQTAVDPHIWLSPPLAKKEAENISQGLIKVDPQNTSLYQSNLKALEVKLDQLDSDYRTGLKNCKEKDIITSHAAFGYLGQEYNLNQVPIAGLSPDEEPSAQQLVEVTKFAKEHNAKYIFFESLVSPKLSETIASEIGAKTLVLDPIEGISDDDIKQGKDYFSVMQANLKNLQTALECN